MGVVGQRERTCAASRRRERPLWLKAIVWLGPTVIVVAVIVTYPMIEMIRTSVSEVSRVGVNRGFAGLANFAGLFNRPELTGIVLQTALWVAAVVVGTYLLSWPVALLLNQPFFGRRWVRYTVIVPWACALPTSALIFQWMFDYNFGIINHALTSLHLVAEPIDWFGQPTMAWVMLISVGIFVSIPFCTFVLLSGLQSVPPELYEASKIDGAGPLRSLFSITVPILRPATFLAVLITLIGVFNSFAVIWVLTKGGPGRQTHTTFTYMYELAFSSRSMGQSAALGVMNLLVLAVIIAIYMWVNRRSVKEI